MKTDKEKWNVAICSGDGIGPEIIKEAVKVLRTLERTDEAHRFEFREAPIGGAAFDVYGCHLPKETLDAVSGSDALLFGSVGGPVDAADTPKWKDAEKNALLGLRQKFDMAVNVRPAAILASLAHLSPLKNEVIGAMGVDIVIVRELVGGIYFGDRGIDEKAAFDTMSYTVEQIKRPLEFAFQTARQRARKSVTVVDKANVLNTSRLWRTVATEMHKDYSDVELKFMYVDNAAMQLIMNPSQFSVVCTENMFGDILSDAASVLPGSLGLMPSASLGNKGLHMFEPSGGSAPDIAGQGVANPIGAILSAALMLRYSMKCEAAASAVEKAVAQTLAKGFRTRDLAREGEKSISTSEMGDAVCKELETVLAKKQTN
eukprot:Selendium_serpulae@DN6055_c1_g1_i4.p2